MFDNFPYLIKKALSNTLKYFCLFYFLILLGLVRVLHDKLVAEFRFKVKWSFVLNN